MSDFRFRYWKVHFVNLRKVKRMVANEDMQHCAVQCRAGFHKEYLDQAISFFTSVFADGDDRGFVLFWSARLARTFWLLSEWQLLQWHVSKRKKTAWLILADYLSPLRSGWLILRLCRTMRVCSKWMNCRQNTLNRKSMRHLSSRKDTLMWHWRINNSANIAESEVGKECCLTMGNDNPSGLLEH